MWFYFSGSGLEKETGAQRRDSRSGSGGDLHGRTAGGGAEGSAGGIEHRKSTAGQEKGAQRRESRGKESAASVQAAPSAGQQQQQQQSATTMASAPQRARKSVSTQQIHRPSTHRGSTISEMAASTIQSTGTIIANILRALLVRALLMAHSMLCIWAAAENHADNSVWAFALVAFCLVGEGFYAVVVRAGDEPKWFSPAIAVYLLSATPPIWLLQSSLCELTVVAASSSSTNNGTIVPQSFHYHYPIAFGLQAPSALLPTGNGTIIFNQLLIHSLFVILLLARWWLPRVELSREELTQILLAYLAIMTDILEFLGLLNSPAICADSSLKSAILSVFALSLFQFTLILSASRSRKMRIAVATKILLSTNRPDIRQAFFDLDIWAILISLACQDVSFLIIRLCLLGWFWNASFGALAFITKNAIVILIQAYRVHVLLNDRYRNPEVATRSMLDEKRQSMALPSGMSLSQYQQHKLSKSVSNSKELTKETAMLAGGGGDR